MSNYKLHIESTIYATIIPFDILLDDVANDAEAITEAQAQLDLMTCDGGFPYDEQWPDVKATLYADGKAIWSDAVLMEFITENDKNLIQEAKEMSRWQWRSIDSLIARADSADTRYELEILKEWHYDLAMESL